MVLEITLLVDVESTLVHSDELKRFLKPINVVDTSDDGGNERSN